MKSSTTLKTTQALHCSLWLATLLVACSGGGRSVIAVPGEIVADPASLDFGVTAPGLSVERSVTISDQGAGTLVISELVIAGDGAASFSVRQPDAMQLSGGRSLSLTLTYAPTAEGSHPAQLLVRSDASNTRELLIPLAGVATVGDPCAGVSCLSPPAGTCKDSGTFISYGSPGACVSGVCQYTATTHSCSAGCVNDVCSPDPCRGMVCDSPAPCFQGGACVGGSCQYQPTPGMHLCSGQCVSESSLSCGPSCVPCTAPTNGTAICANGICDFTCSPGFGKCASGCCAATTATSLSARSQSCAVTIAGGIKCWGANNVGQIGDGTTTNRSLPVDVVGLASGVRAVAAGPQHACALTSAGGVKCWGWNSHGQIGDGTSGGGRLTPVDVVGLGSGVQAIATGLSHTCALTGAGAVKCWGWSFYGQIGDGTTGTDRLTPVDVIGLGSGVQAIATGEDHSCALTSAGAVKCWGRNSDGQVGDGTSGIDRLTPVDVVGLAAGVQAIAAGSHHTCALTAGGGVKCWGQNGFGGIGDGTSANLRLAPVDVLGLGAGAQAIAAGLSHTCALSSMGGVKCWGGNLEGQVGDGTSGTDRLTPVDVLGLGAEVQAVAAGLSHTCALTRAGAIKCWGANFSGQLGDGTAGAACLTPVGVVGF